MCEGVKGRVRGGQDECGEDVMSEERVVMSESV